MTCTAKENIPPPPTCAAEGERAVNCGAPALADGSRPKECGGNLICAPGNAKMICVSPETVDPLEFSECAAAVSVALLHVDSWLAGMNCCAVPPLMSLKLNVDGTVVFISHQFLLIQYSPAILSCSCRVNVLLNAAQLKVQADTTVAAVVTLVLLIGQRSFVSVRLQLIPSTSSRSHRLVPWKVNEPWTAALRQASAGLRAVATALAALQEM